MGLDRERERTPEKGGFHVKRESGQTDTKCLNNFGNLSNEVTFQLRATGFASVWFLCLCKLLGKTGEFVCSSQLFSTAVQT